MKIWYQSTLDFAQHPNRAKALAAQFQKITCSRTAVLLHGRVGDPQNHLPASEIIGSLVVYQSVVDPAFIRTVPASEGIKLVMDMNLQRPKSARAILAA